MHTVKHNVIYMAAALESNDLVAEEVLQVSQLPEIQSLLQSFEGDIHKLQPE